MPSSRARKNGSVGSASASTTPVRRAVKPARAITVISVPSRSATASTSSTTTAQPIQPSIAASTNRPSGDAAASSASAIASSSR